MSHTHASVLVHCVFSTKQRINMIPDPEALWRYLAAVARDNNVTMLAAGGTKNHAHLLLLVPPIVPFSEGDEGIEGEQFEMAARAWVQVRLAGRIWRIQRQPSTATDGDRLHFESRRASSKMEL